MKLLDCYPAVRVIYVLFVSFLTIAKRVFTEEGEIVAVISYAHILALFMKVAFPVHHEPTVASLSMRPKLGVKTFGMRAQFIANELVSFVRGFLFVIPKAPQNTKQKYKELVSRAFLKLSRLYCFQFFFQSEILLV